jgi:hypothetical protein
MLANRSLQKQIKIEVSDHGALDKMQENFYLVTSINHLNKMCKDVTMVSFFAHPELCSTKPPTYPSRRPVGHRPAQRL